MLFYFLVLFFCPLKVCFFTDDFSRPSKVTSFYQWSKEATEKMHGILPGRKAGPARTSWYMPAPKPRAMHAWLKDLAWRSPIIRFGSRTEELWESKVGSRTPGKPGSGSHDSPTCLCPSCHLWQCRFHMPEPRAPKHPFSVVKMSL